MGRLCGGAHEISGIPAPFWLNGWVVGGFLGWVVVGWVSGGVSRWVGGWWWDGWLVVCWWGGCLVRWVGIGGVGGDMGGGLGCWVLWGLGVVGWVVRGEVGLQ